MIELIKTEVVYQDVRLVLSEASILISMRRYRLMEEARAVKESDPDRAFLRESVYPNLVAATVEATGIPWPLTFEEFVELPEALWDAWSLANRKVNKHWYESNGEVTEDSKKALSEPTPSTSA
jgi:hypothetical protein